jgi:hypothetical protein
MEETKQEVTDSEEKNLDVNQNTNENENINNINDLPEPDITEEEMKNIINYINTWDYEKYERDSEVREALLLLRTKMKQEEEEREKKLNELKRKENIISETNINNGDEGNKIDFKEEKIDVDQKNMTVINDNNNINVFRDELSEKEKELLEKNWKTSTKPEFGEKIINEKGDKEIIRDENKVAKKVSKKEKKYEKMEKMIYHKPEVMPSMGKLLLI